MATLTLLTPVQTAGTLIGEEIAAVARTDQFINDGNTLLFVRNGSGADTPNIVMALGGRAGGLTINAFNFTIAPGVTKIVGPFEPRYYNDSNGYAQIAYSSVADLFVRAIRVVGPG